MTTREGKFLDTGTLYVVLSAPNTLVSSEKFNFLPPGFHVNATQFSKGSGTIAIP